MSLRLKRRRRSFAPPSANSGQSVFSCSARLLLILCVLGLSALAQTAPEPKQITVYTAETTYSLPVFAQDGNEYAGLLEILEPLGNVSAKLDGKKWKLHFAGHEAQFTTGSPKARIRNREVAMAAPFLAANGRGFVPLRSLAEILNNLVPGRALSFHEQARRLFFDRAELRYTAEVKRTAPPQLTLTFSAPVNPSIATEPGRLRMLFRREPLLANAGTETMRFTDPLISSLSYSESNGTAELVVGSSAALLASYSSDRKTITITTLAPAVAQAAPEGSRPAAASPSSTSAPAIPKPPQPRFVVVIDPAHGGSDPGAVITPTLLEKDVTMSLARRLAKELETRGIASRLLREGDTALTTDQRTVLANAATPSLYLALHASASGTGVRMFTAQLAPAPAAKPATFIPWDSAQAAFVSISKSVADALTTELLKRDIPALDMPASVRPLNSVAAPALAIEIGMPAHAGAGELNSPAYQQSICAAIAAVVANARARLPRGEAGR
jgi:N-acetylmuramoyl-L-alanine amidase